MKSLIYLIIASFLVLTSCKKEDIQPNSQVPTEVNQEIGIYGKWVLVGGSMYVENMETGQKTKYDHFGLGKTTSSLNYDGSLFDIEAIEVNVTTWSFYQPPSVPGYGDFVLNGDTQNPYGFYVTKNNWTIMENPQSTSANMQMGGSSRPITATICDYSDSTVYFYIQEGYTSIDNQNYTYISELKFKKIESW
jgi:hypothetical protein